MIIQFQPTKQVSLVFVSFFRLFLYTSTLFNVTYCLCLHPPPFWKQKRPWGRGCEILAKRITHCTCKNFPTLLFFEITFSYETTLLKLKDQSTKSPIFQKCIGENGDPELRLYRICFSVARRTVFGSELQS